MKVCRHWRRRQSGQSPRPARQHLVQEPCQREERQRQWLQQQWVVALNHCQEQKLLVRRQRPQPCVAAPKLVRRRIDWSNDRAMRQIVHRGLSAGDAEWTNNWADFCAQRGISADLAAAQGSGPPKDAVAEFLEQNLTVLLKRDWAKDLMFKAEGQNDELPGEDGGAGASVRKAAAAAASSAAAPGAGCGSAVASGDAPNAKAGATKRTAPVPTASASASSDRRNGGSGGMSDRDSSSGSDSSRSRRKKRRRKDKKKKGMLYGDYMKGITPEVMMMNQMMGMSMMMNNPLAMMGMGAGMMPGMSMLGVKSSRKDDKQKKVSGRYDEKDKRLELRDRERKREGAPEAGATAPPPPPPPPHRSTGAAPVQPKGDAPAIVSDAARKRSRQAMIDAEDL